ncbi:hypothetical protein QTO34_004704 [Cnephaeus nilssonii]|uniref:Uncharacterized protein n=1 Tax=Cnephaeus nilssonii TaxID=3371016 RepID=A0AA40HPN6_CNENI|nr:hypothetical protein QTO34_004704 [Eptesicus nilssonii]
MRPLFAVGLVFAGCCSNVIFLELLVRKHPGCGNIVTFAQFLFIAVEGLLFEVNFGRKQPAIPIRYVYEISFRLFLSFKITSPKNPETPVRKNISTLFHSSAIYSS